MILIFTIFLKDCYFLVINLPLWRVKVKIPLFFPKMTKSFPHNNSSNYCIDYKQTKISQILPWYLYFVWLNFYCKGYKKTNKRKKQKQVQIKFRKNPKSSYIYNVAIKTTHIYVKYFAKAFQIYSIVTT